MDAKVVYWTGAWLNFSLVFAFALVALRRIRAGDAGSHRRYMITAACLVLLFLLSYVVKLMVLGREDMSVWSAGDVNVLRFHESCVGVMVAAGSLNLWLGRRLRSTRNVTGDHADPVASKAVLRTHRIAGRTAVIGAVLGWLSASFVLLGMYERVNQMLTDASSPDPRSVASLYAEAPDRG